MIRKKGVLAYLNVKHLRHAPLKCFPRNMPSVGTLEQGEVALLMLLSSGLGLGYLFQTKFLDQLCA
jgi:hypothetical protein